MSAILIIIFQLAILIGCCWQPGKTLILKQITQVAQIVQYFLSQQILHYLPKLVRQWTVFKFNLVTAIISLQDLLFFWTIIRYTFKTKDNFQVAIITPDRNNFPCVTKTVKFIKSITPTQSVVLSIVPITLINYTIGKITILGARLTGKHFIYHSSSDAPIPTIVINKPIYETTVLFGTVYVNITSTSIYGNFTVYGNVITSQNLQMLSDQVLVSGIKFTLKVIF